MRRRNDCRFEQTTKALLSIATVVLSIHGVNSEGQGFARSSFPGSGISGAPSSAASWQAYGALQAAPIVSVPNQSIYGVAMMQDKERKRVVELSIQAMLIGAMIAITSDAANADPSFQNQIANESAAAAQEADAICGQIPRGGSVTRQRVEGDIEAGIPSILKRLGIRGNARLQGDLENEKHVGVEQVDLPAEIKDDRACRLSVLHLVQDKIEQNERQPLNVHASSSSSAQAFATTGPMSQVVTINPHSIPNFTITPSGMGYDNQPSSYHVVKDEQPESDGAVAPDAPQDIVGVRELIEGQPLLIGHTTKINFVATTTVNGREHVILQSYALWDSTIIRIGDRSFASAVSLPENGEPYYFNLNGRVYFLTVGVPRRPSDGSDPRVEVTIYDKDPRAADSVRVGASAN